MQMRPVPDYSLSEMTFVPRKKGAPEGDGYLIGIGEQQKESGRSDLILVRHQGRQPTGPVARVKMPFRCVGQVHGFWADPRADTRLAAAHAAGLVSGRFYGYAA